MIEGSVEAVPRATRKAYMSAGIRYAGCARPAATAPEPRRRVVSHGPDGLRHRAAAPTRSGLAGQLEPDARQVSVAVDAPAIGHLVDEQESQTAWLERAAVLA